MQWVGYQLDYAEYCSQPQYTALGTSDSFGRRTGTNPVMNDYLSLLAVHPVAISETSGATVVASATPGKPNDSRQPIV